MLRIVHTNKAKGTANGYCRECGWSWLGYSVRDLRILDKQHRVVMHPASPAEILRRERKPAPPVRVV